MGQLLISPILDLAECNIYGVDVVESFSGPKKGVEWLWFFVSTRVLIFTAERVPISGLTITWRLSCLRVPQLDVIILLDKTSSYSKCDWLPRMGFFCLWELRTSCKDFFSEELIFLVRSSKYKQNPVKEFPWMKITSQKRALSSINCRQTKVCKREPR